MKRKTIIGILISLFLFSCTSLTNKTLDVLLNDTFIKKDKLLVAMQCIQKMIDTYDVKKGYDLNLYSYKNVLFYNLQKQKSENAVVYVHGGGFLINYVNSNRFYFVQDLMDESKINFESIFVDYKGDKYPIQNIETEVILKYIMKKYNKVIVVADSSGGNIALSVLLKMRDEGYKLPDGLVLLSPFTDFTNVVPSRKYNFNKDILFGKKYIDLLYNNPYVKNVKDKTLSYVSPVYGKYENFPKTLIQCCNTEMLKDDSVLVYNKMKKDKVNVKLEIWDNCIHAFQLISIFSETKKAKESIVKFLEEIYYDKRIEHK